MRAGLLKEILVFEEPTEIKTPAGSIEKEWSPVFSCKAYKKKLTASGGEEMNAYEDFIEKTVIFQTYQYPIIKDTMRIRWSGNLYRIVLLDPQRQDRSYLITCRKENV